VPHHWPDYELIDFGRAGKTGGRKLERFGDAIIDRPCPAADGERIALPDAWKEAAARYTGARVGDGKWRLAEGLRPSECVISIPLADDSAFWMQLELTPAGQVGLFPEQFANWQWIADRVRRRSAVKGEGEQPRVLNLFGYTGGSTLAAALAGEGAGAQVTHVDASKPSVALARRNAELSGLADAPIRWIVEDAVRYCQREVKRGSRYDAVILDPPSYGHGPKGEEWRLARDLPRLLELCGELTNRAQVFFLATCHTPGVGPAELSAYMSDAIVGHCGQPPADGRLWLADRSGRRLESGVYARWPR
jgi:23S rRNA (cytosine1962-C5)-methyltransferase